MNDTENASRFLLLFKTDAERMAELIHLCIQKGFDHRTAVEFIANLTSTYYMVDIVRALAARTPYGGQLPHLLANCLNWRDSSYAFSSPAEWGNYINYERWELREAHYRQFQVAT